MTVARADSLSQYTDTLLSPEMSARQPLGFLFVCLFVFVLFWVFVFVLLFVF